MMKQFLKLIGQTELPALPGKQFADVTLGKPVSGPQSYNDWFAKQLDAAPAGLLTTFEVVERVTYADVTRWALGLERRAPLHKIGESFSERGQLLPVLHHEWLQRKAEQEPYDAFHGRVYGNVSVCRGLQGHAVMLRTHRDDNERHWILTLSRIDDVALGRTRRLHFYNLNEACLAPFKAKAA